MFKENKFYTHRNFLDVYFKILVDYCDDKYFVSWYNKNFKVNPNFIATDTVTIKNKEGYSDYAPK